MREGGDVRTAGWRSPERLVAIWTYREMFTYAASFWELCLYFWALGTLALSDLALALALATGHLMSWTWTSCCALF